MILINAELISLGSFGVSLVAAIIAARSLHNSSRALKLAESESGEKRLAIDPYLIQAKKVVLQDASYAAFAISFTNRASAPNTLSNVELLITYIAAGDEARQIYLPVEQTFPKGIADIKCLDIPINISARAATSGWVVFKLPEHIRKHPIKAYAVNGYTAEGRKVTVTSYLLMDAILHESSGE
jgi:hypothetical protein